MSVTSKTLYIEAICTYLQDVFISDIWIFEKSIEYRFNSALVRTKANYLFDASTKHGIYNWKKLFEGKLSLTYLSSITINIQNIKVS